MRAVNLLRSAPHYRREAFSQGLLACGYTLADQVQNPSPGDLLLIWNRYGGWHETATQWEARGATVLVAENCPLGNDWRSGHWYSLAKSNPAIVGGRFANHGADRWDQWNVTINPLREHGGTLILGQRGIGHEDTASPREWAERVRSKIGGRIRQHPGTRIDAKPLEDDLSDILRVYTWASSAAIRAMLLGVRVRYDHPEFVMKSAAAPISASMDAPENRLNAFRNLAWCMWELNEIRSGQAIRSVLG